MAIPAGTRLEEFEILTLLGAGGMGEVYRARDTKLGRDVAIKVLPEAWSRDEERLLRLEREAKLLAALNHPSIATLHGLGEADGIRFLTMELVEGESLAERISRGRLSFEEALPLFRQIADALQAAHDKSILHRDLKPANVKITPEGTVKLLDFGLGKTVGESAPPDDLSRSPTAAKTATGAGVILGTASYMSPEQTRGKRLDARTDVWSFGCVLYEALTGKKAFDGETATDVIAAVVSREPDWSSLPPETPSQAREVLEKCLRKDPARRLRSVVDAVLDLEEVRKPPVTIASRPRSWLAFAGGAALTALLLGGFHVFRETDAESPTPKRFVLPLREGSTVNSLPVISRDGSTVVYAGFMEDGRGMLFVRPLERSDAMALEGTEGASGSPFFSPDGRWVGFYAHPYLKVSPISGGAARSVAKVEPFFYGAWWTSDGSILFSTGKSIARVLASGGTPDVLFEAEEDENILLPVALPGGNAVLYTAVSRTGSRVAVARWDTPERRILVEKATNGTYVATGHLVFTRDSSLFATPFDLESLAFTGTPKVVVENVGRIFNQFSVSDDGTLLYADASSPAFVFSRLVWVDREGNVSPLSDTRRRFVPHPRLSPDGRRLVVAISDLPDQDVWLLDLARGAFLRVTTPIPGVVRFSVKPLWGNDGRSIVYTSDVGNAPLHFTIFEQGLDGGDRRRVTTGAYRAATWVSSDGGTVVFRQQSDVNSRDRDVGMVRLDAEEEPRLLLDSRFDEHSAVLSPDDRWMAYVSNESGREEVYVRRFPGLEARALISTEGGAEPLWSRDGKELFYRNGDRMMAVRILTAGPELIASPPRLLFQGRFQRGDTGGSPSTNYDVTEDGRFVMIQEDEAASEVTYHIVLHWTEELKRLVPP